MSAARGTTPTFELVIDGVDLTAASHIYVSFKHLKEVLTLTSNDIEINVKTIGGEPHTTIHVYLNQKQTLKFTSQVRIQVNWTYPNGSRASTNVVNYTFLEQLLNEVVE